MNRIALESKKDMKKRGLPSPDEADAFVLTFANPVKPRHNAPGRPMSGELIKPVYANNVYSLFG